MLLCVDARRVGRVGQLTVKDFQPTIPQAWIKPTLIGQAILYCNTVHVRYAHMGGLGASLVNQTVFRERACASERGRGRRENTVWPNLPGF